MYICVVGATRNADDMFVVICVLVVLNAIFLPHTFFSHFCSFMVVWGSGVGVLSWAFEVWVFSLWGSGPVVWAFLRFS